MADAPNQPQAPLPTAEEVAAQNAATIAKLKAQEGTPRPDPVEQQATGDALDALLKQAEKKAGQEPEPEPQPEVKPAAPAADDPAAKAAAEEAAKKAEAEKAAKEADLKKADDYFKDSPSLPQGASVKSHEAFSSIKIKAAQEIGKLSTDLEAARAELAKIKEASGKPSPEFEQMRKRNEELEQKLAKFDVDLDPKFKEYDKGVDQAREFIYAQLRKNPAITEDTIKKIKEVGGPDMIVMKPVMDALKDTTAQRLIEAKLADIEMAKYNKEQAIKQTKDNVAEYMTTRQAELQKASTASVDATKKELDTLWNELPWTKPVELKQGATAEEKKQAETHAQFVGQMRKELDDAMKEIDTPKMRATLLTSVAQLFNLQAVHKHLKDAHTALEKEVTELRAFKEKVKSATRSRLPESQAPSSGAPVVQKPTNIFNTNAGDALDAAAKQVMEQRAARANA